MLHSLDVLIGFAAIMLLVSLAVTALTQAVIAGLGWRGRHLLGGVVNILNQIDPKLTPYCARLIAKAVLRHPLVAHGAGPAIVIQREELAHTLLELAAGREPGGKLLDEYARSELKKMLENNGIADAAAALDSAHLLAMKLEMLRPEMPAAVRHAMALVTEAPSRFVGRIHACFDATMDRVTERFVRNARAATIVLGVAAAFGLQLDAFDILKRLSVDSATRSALGAMASNAAPAASISPDGIAQLRKLADSGYAVVPEHWRGEWNVSKYPGIALSAILLSLGAPFWYNALKDLVGLRPVLARKEQAHREQRQSAREAAVSSAPLPGERGNLPAAGAVS